MHFQKFLFWLFSTFLHWCGALTSLLAIALQCEIINSIKGHYFAWKTDGWKNNEQQNRCRQVPIQRLYSDTWCDNRNVIYLPFYAVIEWFQVKFRHAHSFKKKHKKRLLDLRLDYKAIKVIRDLHLKCIIYCWVLSIVVLGLIMVVSHCFWSQKLCERHGHIMILCKDQIIKHVSCRQHHACTSVFTLLALWPFMSVHVSWTLA